MNIFHRAFLIKRVIKKQDRVALLIWLAASWESNSTIPATENHLSDFLPRIKISGSWIPQFSWANDWPLTLFEINRLEITRLTFLLKQYQPYYFENQHIILLVHRYFVSDADGRAKENSSLPLSRNDSRSQTYRCAFSLSENYVFRKFAKFVIRFLIIEHMLVEDPVLVQIVWSLSARGRDSALLPHKLHKQIDKRVP